MTGFVMSAGMCRFRMLMLPQSRPGNGLPSDRHVIFREDEIVFPNPRTEPNFAAEYGRKCVIRPNDRSGIVSHTVTDCAEVSHVNIQWDAFKRRAA
jgi:hypothetical protein